MNIPASIELLNAIRKDIVYSKNSLKKCNKNCKYSHYLQDLKEAEGCILQATYALDGANKHGKEVNK